MDNSNVSKHDISNREDSSEIVADQTNSEYFEGDKGIRQDNIKDSAIVTASREPSPEELASMDEDDFRIKEKLSGIQYKSMVDQYRNQREKVKKKEKEIITKKKKLRSSPEWRAMQEVLKKTNKKYEMIIISLGKEKKILQAYESGVLSYGAGQPTQEYIVQQRKKVNSLMLSAQQIEDAFAPTYFADKERYEDIQDIQNTQEQYLDEKGKESEMEGETKKQKKIYNVYHNGRIKKERKRNWILESSASSIREKGKEKAKNMDKNDYGVITQQEAEIKSLYKRVEGLNDKLPITDIRSQAIMQFREIEQTYEWKIFLDDYEKKGGTEYKARQIMINHLTIQILNEYVAQDKELQQLIVEEDENFGVLGVIKEEFDSITKNIVGLTERMKLVSRKTYGWDMVDEYSSVISRKKYSSSIASYLEKPVDTINILGKGPTDILTMRTRLKYMLSLVKSSEEIPKEDSDVVKRYNQLLPGIEELFINKSQFSLNKFSLFGMVAGTQEIMSGQGSQGNKLFDNEHLNLSLENLGTENNKFSYYGQQLQRNYTAQGMNVKNQENSMLDTGSIGFFTLDTIRKNLLETSFSFDDLLAAEHPEEYMESLYEKKLKKYIEDQRYGIENAQEQMRRSVEMQAFVGHMETLNNISSKKYGNTLSDAQRKQYYESLFHGNSNGKVSNDTLQKANDLLATDKFVEFSSSLGISIWTFLEDSSLIGMDSLTSPEMVGNIWRELDLLVRSADNLTAGTRFENFSNMVYLSSGNDISKKYSVGTDESGDVTLSSSQTV